MTSFSFKGFASAIAAMIILFIPVSLVSNYYLVAIYNDVASKDEMLGGTEILLHPLFIVLELFSIFILIGIPSYIAAVIANGNFIQNALSVSVFVLILSLFAYGFMLEFPEVFIAITALSFGFSYLAGALRAKQVYSPKDPNQTLENETKNARLN